MKRGFTIVEVTIVIVVIGILAAITLGAYNLYQDKAADAQAKTMVSVLTSALNAYYGKNNEYPTAEQLFNGTPNGSLPSSYATAAQLLDLNVSVFSQSKAKFMPCSGSGGMSSACSYQSGSWVGGIENVKYITKPSTDLSVYKQYFVSTPNGPNTALQSCELILRSGLEPSQAYILTYWSREESKVKFVRSNVGEVQMNNAQGPCVFTTP